MTSERRNILFIASSDQTGANLPLIKVAAALEAEGHKVQVLVKHKSDINHLITALPLKDNEGPGPSVTDEDENKTRLARDPKYLFSTINEAVTYQDTEVILQYLKFHPHIIFVGVSFDFLSSTDILKLSQVTKAIVYNLAVDMNHFTGGCHFAWDCVGYKNGCDTVECPAILTRVFKDLAGNNFLIKKQNAETGNFRILAGTEWTKKQAEASAIYKKQDAVLNIASVVDTSIYNTRQRHIAKEIFGLESDTFYILAGAENTRDERKGYAYFVNAVNLFWDKLSLLQREKVAILSVTRMLNDDEHRQIKFNKKHIPYIKDERLLSSLYQAADVYVNCSIEDSGPAMLMEAAACGTPVVSFNMGAAQEFVQDGKTGWIAANKDISALAALIDNVYRMPPASRLLMGQAGHDLVHANGSLTKAVHTVETILHYHKDEFATFNSSISVAMCTYNGAEFLAEQLDSILEQNLRPNEIVICDDASTDNTLAILQQYRSRFPEIIRVFSNDKQLGSIKNFEQAINLCTGALIFLCDQDDIWFPHKTETIVKIFDRRPGVMAISHNLQICMKDKELTNLTIWDTTGFLHFLKSSYKAKDYLSHAVFFGNMVTGSALCFRRPSEQVQLKYDIAHVIHDYQLALPYLREGSMYFQDECLGLYRQHEGQQVGAVLNKVILHTRSVKMYYEFGNPLWNLLYINKRMAREGIFNYLKKYDQPLLQSLLRKARAKNVYNALLPKNWLQQSAFFARTVIGRLNRFVTGTKVD